MSCSECPNAGLSDRIQRVEMDSARLMAALEGIKANTDELVSFSRTQVRMEERQLNQGQAIERAFAAIKECNDDGGTRLAAIEAEIPTLVLARKMVFASMIWMIMMTATMAWQIIFRQS